MVLKTYREDPERPGHLLHVRVDVTPPWWGATEERFLHRAIAAIWAHGSDVVAIHIGLRTVEADIVIVDGESTERQTANFRSAVLFALGRREEPSGTVEVSMRQASAGFSHGPQAVAAPVIVHKVKIDADRIRAGDDPHVSS